MSFEKVTGTNGLCYKNRKKISKQDDGNADFGGKMQVKKRKYVE